MNIKLDEKLPAALAGPLSALGHDIDTVPAEGLAGKPDEAVWQAAQNAGRFLITQDLDFSDIRRFAPGTPHRGILLVRLAEPGRQALVQQVEAAFRSEDVSGWGGCFVVLTEHKLRIVHPK